MSNTKHLMNRIHTCKHKGQKDFKKVLCVCSAGLLRSPTAAVVLSREPFNFNTRAIGLIDAFALITIDEVLLAWADEIVCMEAEQKHLLRQMIDKTILCLNIEDSFEYRDPKLMTLIKDTYIKMLERAKND